MPNKIIKTACGLLIAGVLFVVISALWGFADKAAGTNKFTNWF